MSALRAGVGSGISVGAGVELGAGRGVGDGASVGAAKTGSTVGFGVHADKASTSRKSSLYRLMSPFYGKTNPPPVGSWWGVKSSSASPMRTSSHVRSLSLIAFQRLVLLRRR